MHIQMETQGERETGRLEAFSDGVFAIAITLLVLELKVPSLFGHTSAPGANAVTNRALSGALLQMWPSYFALVSSFATVLIMWVHHHAIFRVVRRTDAYLHFANGFLLLMVTFVPYPTSVLAAYLETPAANMAMVFYAGTFVLVAIAFHLVILAAFRPQLLDKNTPRLFIERTRREYSAGPILYSLAVIAAFWSVSVSFAICTALWIFWAGTIAARTRA